MLAMPIKRIPKQEKNMEAWLKESSHTTNQTVTLF
jgi:hypothetical protein